MSQAILVTVGLKEKSSWLLKDRAEELRELAISAGLSVDAEILCQREKPTPDLFIGKGKFNELILLCKTKKANSVVFNNDLSPAQLKNIEKGIGGDIKVIDRTQLILDIFARNAHSLEGKIQVELAQLEYLLPRLTGRGVELSRLGGGIGTSGPGEKILEYDRRRIRSRITKLKVKLKDMAERRGALRKRRKDVMLASIAIIGYTNAGKTTLLNMLTNSNKLVADKLFSTLDPVARGYVLPNNQKILFLDTVGFLYNLPHHLVEAFKATLEEVRLADMLIHVIDASNKLVHEHDMAVYSVLKGLDAENKTIIPALNKIDLIKDVDYIKQLKKDFKGCVLISALNGTGIDLLIDEISNRLSGMLTYIKIAIPNNMMDKVAFIYENGKVTYREDRQDSVYIEATVPASIKNLLL